MPQHQFVTTGIESLARRIALAGLMSRGEAERAISQGLVTVNGRVVTKSQKVPDMSCVACHGVDVAPPPAAPPLFGIIKPRGYVAEFTRTEPGANKRYIPDLLAKWNKKSTRDFGTKSLEVSTSSSHYVVINKIPTKSTGLVLLTTDGLLANALTRIESKILTTYRVRVGNITDSQVDDLRKWKAGIGVAGVDYGPVFIDVEKRKPSQTWMKVRLVDAPGRNLSDLFWFRAGIHVNRINCYAFGPYRATEVPDRQIIRLPIHDAIQHLVPRRVIQPSLVSIRH